MAKKKTGKMPAALKAYWAKRLCKTPRRSNPTVWESVKSSAKRVAAGTKAAIAREKEILKRERARAKAEANRYVSLDGKVVPKGPGRMEIVRKVQAATGAKHGTVRFNNPPKQRKGKRVVTPRYGMPSPRVWERWSPAQREAFLKMQRSRRGSASAAERRENPHTFPSGRKLKVENIRGIRSAKALMAKARKAKAQGKKFHGDVTKAGVHRTVKSASARLQGFTADRPQGPLGGKKGGGIWEDSLAALGAY